MRPVEKCTACRKSIPVGDESWVHVFRDDNTAGEGPRKPYRPFGEMNAAFHKGCAPSQAELAELFAGIIYNLTDEDSRLAAEARNDPRYGNGKPLDEVIAEMKLTHREQLLAILHREFGRGYPFIRADVKQFIAHPRLDELENTGEIECLGHVRPDPLSIREVKQYQLPKEKS